MKITLAQQNYLVGDVRGNLKKIIDVVQQSDAPVVVFPEGALTGSPLYELDMSAQVERALVELATIAPSKEIFIGLYEYTIAYIAGGEIQIIDNNWVQVGDVALFFESNHYYHGAPYENLRHWETEARDMQLTVVCLNQVGASTDTIFYGGSVVCFADGKSVMFPLWQECVRTLDLSVSQSEIVDWRGKTEQTHQALLLAIRDYFAKSGFGQAMVALSGGIDSAVVVALAVEALGAENVRVVLLPSAFSSEHSVADSLEMVRRCGIRHDVINIEPIVERSLESLRDVFKGTSVGLAEENIQARIRLMLTMAICNKTGDIMLNTSNKSEAAVGYGTLYGDTSGALGIIADLYKTEVYELADHINRVSGNLIPQNIIDKAPSAELRPGQKDSDSLPEYHVLDAILYQLIEQGSGEEELYGKFDKEVVDRVVKLVNSSDFKRKQLPPAVRLSGRTFGVEYVMPIVKKV
ncbi:NAD synthetase / Glutamine amidotransferase chain of NAD synthetase [Mucinivorans hirudinis]|uniref:Glutamine-dependent NAD(+) synthetase n=1 Tax=Mucinivorans hirudinis TaxID=1433126 RepID=A0A060RET5_9BACT|nr:NAD synthetase / Glutamine amidotransferase chain of NAD synthetase [Mucinivorans hirudinis]